MRCSRTRREQTPCIHIPLSLAGEIIVYTAAGHSKSLKMRSATPAARSGKKKQDAATNLPIKKASHPQLR